VTAAGSDPRLPSVSLGPGISSFADFLADQAPDLLPALDRLQQEPGPAVPHAEVGRDRRQQVGGQLAHGRARPPAGGGRRDRRSEWLVGHAGNAKSLTERLWRGVWRGMVPRLGVSAPPPGPAPPTPFGARSGAAGDRGRAGAAEPSADGRAAARQRPGLGVTIDPDKLARYRVDG